MSLFRCGGGGGMLEETVLWTNPSPTSDFAATVVNLSDDISNYDYIKFEYLMHKSYLSKSAAIYKSEDISNWQVAGTTTSYVAYGALGGRGTADQKRSLMYKGTDSIQIYGCTGWNNTTAANSCLVPTSIIGLKFSNRRPSAPQTAVGSFSIGSTDINVVLGFKPKYICIEYALSNTVISTLVYNEDAASDKQIISGRNGSNANCTIENLPYTGTSGGRITSLNSDGFTLKQPSTTYGTIGRYFAIG